MGYKRGFACLVVFNICAPNDQLLVNLYDIIYLIYDVKLNDMICKISSIKETLLVAGQL